MAAGMGRGICMLATILALISFSQAISITLDPSNPKVCFYIRGENVDSEFILNYGYSGDGFDSVRTTVNSLNFSSRTSKRRHIFTKPNQATRWQSTASSTKRLTKTRSTVYASKVWTETESSFPSTTLKQIVKSTSPRVS